MSNREDDIKMNDHVKKPYTKPSFEYWIAEELDKIMAHMSGGYTPVPAIGTKLNPRVFLSGDVVTVSVSQTTEYYFKCTVAGATNFGVMTSKAATIKIYKMISLVDTLLDTISNAAQNTAIRLMSNPGVSSGTNTYIISIKPTTSSICQIECEVSQHVDVANFSKSATWTPLVNSPVVSTHFIYTKYLYADKDSVAGLYVMINESTFLEMMEKISNLELSIELAVLTYATPLGIIPAIAALLITGFTGFGDLFAFRDMFLDKLKSIAEYNNITNTFAKGACLIEYYYDGLPLYDLQAWTPPAVYGPGGWVGSWEGISEGIS
jgi:hypothetical protein